MTVIIAKKDTKYLFPIIRFMPNKSFKGSAVVAELFKELCIIYQRIYRRLSRYKQLGG